MSSFTRKAIVDAFIRIAEKKPLQKITVRDIVDDCGINRNTFYYYFKDIYDVAESLFSYPDDALPLGIDPEDDLGLTVGRLLSFAVSHRELIRNLYRSVGYEGMERYMHALLGQKLEQAIRRTADAEVPEADVAFLCRFLQKAVFGIIVDWFADGMKEDPSLLTAKLHRISMAAIRAWAQGNTPV